MSIFRDTLLCKCGKIYTKQIFYTCKMTTTFASALTAFCEDLLPTFPELAAAITAVQARPVADVEKEFVTLWK